MIATTADDVLALINKEFPDVRVETSAEGMLQITMTPLGRHQRISARIARWLVMVFDDEVGDYVIPTLGIDAAGANRVPDLVVLKAPASIDDEVVYQRAEIVALVIEIISRSTAAVDLHEKIEDYARAGIPNYWIARDDMTVQMYRLINGAYVTNGGAKSFTQMMFMGDVGGIEL